MTTPSLALLHAQLRREAFALDRRDTAPPRVGAEVEFMPLEVESRRIAAIDADDRPSTLRALRPIARRLGWCEFVSDKAGVPELRTPHGGRITFEPGGQIEYSAPPRRSLSALLLDLRDVADAIGAALEPCGIELAATGIDPVNGIDDVPLQLAAARYRRMDAHFASIGPHGAQMMRQTASIQVCLDAGAEPLTRWKLLNALAPYCVAIFANSPVYRGAATGHRSIRRFIWGTLDPARTGLPWDAERPVESYADFALDASALLGPAETPPFPSFGTWWESGEADLDDWRTHLTTLFPEVRPRGYFEVRSIDALEPDGYVAPLVFLVGLTYDPATARLAGEIAGAPDPALLERAGRCGLSDGRIASVAAELVDLAMRGATSLGPQIVAPGDVVAAHDWFARHTLRRVSPADAYLTGVAD